MEQVSEQVVVVNEIGTFWYNEQGKLHREDGPAIEYSNGDKLWYINGECHREDGPAVKYSDGAKCWYINDELHREDGPAIEYVDGTKFWYINNVKYSETEFNQIMAKKNLG